MGIAAELNLRANDKTPLIDLDRTDYHPIHDGKLLEETLNTKLYQVDYLNVGLLALLTYDNSPRHLGILANYDNMRLSIIHANISCRMVVESIIDQDMFNKITNIYNISHS